MSDLRKRPITLAGEVLIPEGELYRLRKGMRLEKLAKLMRLAPRTVREIERKGWDDAETASRMASYIDAPANVFLIPRRVAISKMEYNQLRRALPPLRAAGRRRQPKARF